MRGHLKQVVMSMNISKISSSGKLVRKLYIHVMKSMNTYPKVICASFSVGVISFIATSRADLFELPFHINLGFSGKIAKKHEM